MARRKKKRGLANNSIYYQGRSCPIRSAGIQEINHKDIEFLKMFLTEKGKIVPRRITGVCSAKQKELAKAIKRARNLALLSFSEGYVSLEKEQEMNQKTPFDLKTDTAVIKKDLAVPDASETKDKKTDKEDL